LQTCRSGAEAAARLKPIDRLFPGEAELEKTADVLAEAAFAFRAKDGVGTAAMQAQSSSRSLFQNNLVDESTARYFPDRAAAGSVGLWISIGEPVGVRPLHALPVRPWKKREQYWRLRTLYLVRHCLASVPIESWR